VIDEPARAAAQAVAIACDGRVPSVDGTQLAVRAESLCVHGDTPRAPTIAAAVRRALAERGVNVAAIGRGASAA
jgi:UPF0271 protein